MFRLLRSRIFFDGLWEKLDRERELSVGKKAAAEASRRKKALSRSRLLAFTILLTSTTAFSRARQSGFEKQQELPSKSIQEKVRRNLAAPLEDEDAIRKLFALGDKAVPPLIKFLSDPDNIRRQTAAERLAFIGNRQGMEALRTAIHAERNHETKVLMSCSLAGGLVETKSESDLQFLKSSVEKARFADDDASYFPALCAALALGMMERGDSFALLRKLAAEEKLGSEEITKAIKWMENKSTPEQAAAGPSQTDEELIKRTVLERTFFAQGERDETSLTHFTFAPGHKKVLVSLETNRGPKSGRSYDLVLAKENGVWRVAGIWFTRVV